MEKIREFREKLGKKKLIEGITREDVKLYQEVSKIMDSFIKTHQEKISHDNDDLELFVRLVQKKKNKRPIIY